MTQQDPVAPAPREPDGPLMDHEYDGIREYDNPLPTWFRQIYWGTILFGIGYFAYYHVLGAGTSLKDAYAEDMREHRLMLAEQAPSEEVSDESLAKLAKDPAMVEDGKATFLLRCQPCHADRGQGNIGPNLTDDYWIHGSGSLTDIYKVVNEGVPDKGMPPWGMQLSPVELRQVAAFVASLRGKNIKGKPPQGQQVTSAAETTNGN